MLKIKFKWFIKYVISLIKLKLSDQNKYEDLFYKSLKLYIVANVLQSFSLM